MFISVINPEKLKKELLDYNWSLLFNRPRAQKLRRNAAERIHKFADRKLFLEEQDCELMYVYIKTFAYTAHRKVTKDALTAFDLLTQIADYQRPLNTKRFTAKIYNLTSIFSRRIARILGRYDRIRYEAPLLPETPPTSPQTSQKTNRSPYPRTASNNTEPKSAENVRQTKAERLKRIKKLRSEQIRYQKQRLKERQKAEKERARRKKAKQLQTAAPDRSAADTTGQSVTPVHTVSPARTQTAATAIRFKTSNRLSRQPNTFKHSRNRIINTLIGTAALLGTIGGISVLYDGIKRLTADKNNNPKNNKTEKLCPVQNTARNIKPTILPAPDAGHKAYYDSALSIHLGEAGRDALYDSLRNMAITHKITIPTGESIEHLAHILTVSNLVRPNTADNRFLQACLHSREPLSGAAQNKLWHIVGAAGNRAQNIKGSSSHSNFAGQSPQIQQAHLKTLYNLRQNSK